MKQLNTCQESNIIMRVIMIIMMSMQRSQRFQRLWEVCILPTQDSYMAILYILTPFAIYNLPALVHLYAMHLVQQVSYTLHALQHAGGTSPRASDSCSY